MMPSTTSFSDKLSFDVQGVDKLRTKVISGDAGALQATAREFEAMMVNMMLKTMRETSFEDPEHRLFGSQAMQMYRDLLDQQWSRKAAEGRGFGFADMLMRQFKTQQPKPVDAGAAAAHLSSKATVSQPEWVSNTENGMAADEIGQPAAQAAAPAGLSDTARQFMQRMRPYADAAAQRLGVPAEYVLAHAGLESGWGQREIKRADGGPSYNLFGIKAGKGWQGDVAQTLTTEYQYGLPVKKQEPFRISGSYAESFDDYARLLERRYAGAIGQADALAFSNGLQQAGYASDPRYGEKLNRLIGQLT